MCFIEADELVTDVVLFVNDEKIHLQNKNTFRTFFENDF